MSKRPISTDVETGTKSKRNKTSSPMNPAEMATPQTTKRILVLGLAGHGPGQAMSAASKQPRGQFRKMLQETTSKAKDSGLELEIMQLKPSAFESGLRDIKAKLASKPDGLLIGNGIRGTAAYTVFFEDVVNACREITPGTRMAFNTSPNDILECCLRNFK